MKQDMIRDTLDTYAERAVGDTPDLWPAIHRRIRPRPAVRVHRSFALGVISVCVLLAVALILGRHMLAPFPQAGVPARNLMTIPATQSPVVIQAPGISREEIVRKAREDAKYMDPGTPSPSIIVEEARIDSVTAELLAEAHDTLVWRVTVRGYFRYRLTNQPPGAPASTPQFGEKVLLYDAQNGRLLQGNASPGALLTPTVVPVQPTATSASTKATQTTTPAPTGTLDIVIPGTQFEQTSPGSQVIVSGTWGSAHGQFGKGMQGSGPTSFAVDAQGDIFIIDAVNRRVQRFDGNGVYRSSFPIAGMAEDIAVAPDGSLYVLDAYGQHTIVHYRTDGVALRTYPIAREIALLTPDALSVAGSDVYVQSLGPETDPTIMTYQVLRNGQPLSAAEQVASGIKGWRPAQLRPWVLSTRVIETGNRSSSTTPTTEQRVPQIRVGVRGSGIDRTFRVLLERPVGSVIGIEVDRNVTVYLQLLSVLAGPAPNFTAQTQVTVAAFTLQGQYLGKAELPERNETQIGRFIRITPSGMIYQLHTTAAGVQIIRWPLVK